MVIAYIYVLRNPLTNEIRYVGQTTRKEYRFKEHISDAKQKIGDEYVNNRYVCKWIRKIIALYGIPPIYEIIDSAENGEQIDALEISYINNLSNKGIKLTNLNGGGKSTFKLNNNQLNQAKINGKKKAERTRKHVLQYTKDGVFINEFDSLTDAAKSIGDNKSIRNNISGCCSNKPNKLKSAYGFIWVAKQENENLGKEISKSKEKIKNNKKKIAQYDLEGNLLACFNSMTEASIHTKISNSKISPCINGKLKSSGGYQWLEYEDIPIEKIKAYEKPLINCKSVIKCDLQGNLIKEYKSIKEAAKEHDIHSASIISNMKGIMPTCVGHIWKYSN